MSIRRLLAGAGVGAVLGLGVLAAPSAQAAGNMEFYDDFWTKQECEDVGSDGVEKGMWRIYDCQESWFDWDLYVGY